MCCTFSVEKKWYICISIFEIFYVFVVMKKFQFKKWIENKLKYNKDLADFLSRPEFIIFAIFCWLFFILVLRLFFVQIINHKKYDEILNSQHFTQSSLHAERWDILAYDKAGNEVKLTENISMYNMYVDPKYIWDKELFINLIYPVVYEHLCVLNWMNKVDKEWCIKNIETFTNRDILPKAPEFFYMWNWIVSEWYYSYDWTWFYENYNNVVENFSTWTAESMIKSALDRKIQIWIKEQNYLWFFANEDFISDLYALELPCVLS